MAWHKLLLHKLIATVSLLEERGHWLSQMGSLESQEILSAVQIWGAGEAVAATEKGYL